jgi:hypothetical protein
VNPEDDNMTRITNPEITNPKAPLSGWPAVAKRLRQAGLGAALVAAAATAGPVQAAAVGATRKSDRIEVGYRDVARLTEFDSSPGARRDWVDALSKYTLVQAGRVLPAGQKLSVTIIDVQRAGGYEPGRMPATPDIRIVRESTPPRIDLSFRIESAQGAVLKEGERRLRDANFMNRVRHRGEALGYEKNLIDDWLRKDVAPAKR